MGFFANRYRNEALRTYGGPRPVDPEVISPDMVLTWMDAADQRGTQFSLDLLGQSLEAARKRGNHVRCRIIVKHLRWLAKEAAKDGIIWEQVP